MAVSILGVCFLGSSQKMTLAEASAKLNVSPATSGSHSIGDPFRRRGEDHTFDYTLLRIDSGEPESAPLELHLEGLAARMKAANDCYKHIFEDAMVRVTVISNQVSSDIDLSEKCIQLVDEIGVGFNFGLCMSMAHSTEVKS